MRYLATVLLLCSALTHAAPPDGFALVHDADGHTNLRESPDLNARVLAKIPNGTPLKCLGDGGEGSLSFCTAQLQQPAAEDYGFIHYSRLIFPASDKSFVRLREQSGRDDTLTLSGSGQTVRHRSPPHPSKTQRLRRVSAKTNTPRGSIEANLSMVQRTTFPKAYLRLNVSR